MKQKITLNHPLLIIKLSIIVLTLFLSFTILKPEALQALDCCNYFPYSGEICCGKTMMCSPCSSDENDGYKCVGTVLPAGGTCSY